MGLVSWMRSHLRGGPSGLLHSYWHFGKPSFGQPSLHNLINPPSWLMLSNDHDGEILFRAQDSLSLLLLSSIYSSLSQAI